jgi:hypothetical protein
MKGYYIGGARMSVGAVHTYLVHPGKGVEERQQIRGAAVPLEGKLFRLLDGIYGRSDVECDIEISFNHATDGSQSNVCRDLIIAYLADPTLVRGRRIAERLQSVSDRRPGLGLVFLIAGREGKEHKLVLSRFPTDSAILADEDQRNFTVEFLERVFMKSATSYKAAAYQGASLTADFWLGRVVDRQVVLGSDYWTTEFLASGFRLTPAAGTRQLGIALRQAAKNAQDVNVKSEIAAAVTLAGSMRGRQTSIRAFSEQFGLSEAAQNTIFRELRHPGLAEERFRFDADEFRAQVAFRSVELDNGGMLTAQSSDFDDVFTREVLDEVKNEVRFSTSGRVINEKLRKVQ